MDSELEEFLADIEHYPMSASEKMTYLRSIWIALEHIASDAVDEYLKGLSSEFGQVSGAAASAEDGTSELNAAGRPPHRRPRRKDKGMDVEP